MDKKMDKKIKNLSVGNSALGSRGREGDLAHTTCPVSTSAFLNNNSDDSKNPEGKKRERLNDLNLKTRESWLQAATIELRSTLFKEAGYDLPPVHVSTGIAGSSRRKSIVTGVCFSKDASEDRINQIFIDPLLESGLEALDTLVHELVHATVGIDKGHGKVFRKCAIAVGLSGPMRSTVAGPELTERLNDLIEKLGPYPHSKLNHRVPRKKKDGTRNIKVVCPNCGYTVRTTRKWLEYGLPYCGNPFCELIKMKEEEKSKEQGC